MRILYVFPHPDDESFGPAPGMAQQLRQGHEVYLLTLTRGEATKQRERYGFSKEKMGAVRYDEMQAVARTLCLTGLTVLDFPDGGLQHLDPREIEDALTAHIAGVQPAVVVTYAVHGISGHPDHLVGHAVVKRVFCALRAEGASYLQRLAFFTLTEPAPPGRPAHLKSSPAEAVDCVLKPLPEDLEQGERALACYETYQAVVQAHDPLSQVRDGIAFELYQENFDPPLADLFAGLGR